jgi:hypothetical protein
MDTHIHEPLTRCCSKTISSNVWAGFRSRISRTVLANTLFISQDLSEYGCPNVELVVSPVENAAASATKLTCLQPPIPDVLIRSADFRGHIQRQILRIFRIRAYLELRASCRPSPPHYMRVISGTGRSALALFFASREHNFKMSSC